MGGGRQGRHDAADRPRATLRFALALAFVFLANDAFAISPGCRYINDHAVAFLYTIAYEKKLHAYSGQQFDEGDRITFRVKSPNALDPVRFSATARSGAWIARPPDEDGRAALILLEDGVWDFHYYSPIRISVSFRVVCDPAGRWTPDDPSVDWPDDSSTWNTADD